MVTVLRREADIAAVIGSNDVVPARLGGQRRHAFSVGPFAIEVEIGVQGYEKAVLPHTSFALGVVEAEIFVSAPPGIPVVFSTDFGQRARKGPGRHLEDHDVEPNRVDIADRSGGPGLSQRVGIDGKRDRGQRSDDGHDEQQLDEGKTRGVVLHDSRVTHRLWS